MAIGAVAKAIEGNVIGVRTAARGQGATPVITIPITIRTGIAIAVNHGTFAAIAIQITGFRTRGIGRVQAVAESKHQVDRRLDRVSPPGPFTFTRGQRFI